MVITMVAGATLDAETVAVTVGGSSTVLGHITRSSDDNHFGGCSSGQRQDRSTGSCDEGCHSSNRYRRIRTWPLATPHVASAVVVTERMGIV